MNTQNDKPSTSSSAEPFVPGSTLDLPSAPEVLGRWSEGCLWLVGCLKFSRSLRLIAACLSMWARAACGAGALGGRTPPFAVFSSFRFFASSEQWVGNPQWIFLVVSGILTSFATTVSSARLAALSASMTSFLSASVSCSKRSASECKLHLRVLGLCPSKLALFARRTDAFASERVGMSSCALVPKVTRGVDVVSLASLANNRDCFTLGGVTRWFLKWYFQKHRNTEISSKTRRK
jgi:hypothetical protein